MNEDAAHTRLLVVPRPEPRRRQLTIMMSLTPDLKPDGMSLMGSEPAFSSCRLTQFLNVRSCTSAGEVGE